MLDEWTGYVVGRCHIYGISQVDLAARCGFSAPYLSTVLAGKKGDENTKEKILATLADMEREIRRDLDNE